MEFKQLLFVGVGGALGSIARYMASGIFTRLAGWPDFPAGTLGVNLIGCLIIGIVTGIIEVYQIASFEFRLFIITGILGGFTTFSSFGFETVFLLRKGMVALAVANVLSSVGFGLVAVWAGLKAVELIGHL